MSKVLSTDYPCVYRV